MAKKQTIKAEMSANLERARIASRDTKADPKTNSIKTHVSSLDKLQLNYQANGRIHISIMKNLRGMFRAGRIGITVGADNKAAVFSSTDGVSDDDIFSLFSDAELQAIREAKAVYQNTMFDMVRKYAGLVDIEEGAVAVAELTEREKLIAEMGSLVADPGFDPKKLKALQEQLAKLDD